MWSQPRGQLESATSSDDSNRTATTRDDPQPLVPITIPTVVDPSTATTSSSDAEQNARTATQQPEQVEYPRLPTVPAPPNLRPLRRSGRESRAPSRFEP